ncbi:hypothetical protein EGR_06984 [Echinococcus granulosus]|uniref:Uncharacterized protein n=1 Tax=Echinococcus granulosus TaxID=6210 RepID=W6UXA7_ECHGR|nr:hypothetical protein EGR_06984 [Echinococcus granulosus]EUB58154.1 hypothetical protein EGR_06984 [Echinococcus granulosus]
MTREVTVGDKVDGRHIRELTAPPPPCTSSLMVDYICPSTVRSTEALWWDHTPPKGE